MSGSKKQGLPPEVNIDTNVEEDGPTSGAAGYHVLTWCAGKVATKLGEKSHGSEVHLVLPVGDTLIIALRLKSARALDELVGVLLRHRADVGGEGNGGAS